MTDETTPRSDTVAIRAGREANGNALAPVLWASSAFVTPDAKTAQRFAQSTRAEQFYSRHGGQGSPFLRCTFYVLPLWTINIDKQRFHLQRPIRVSNPGFRTPEGFKMHSPGWFIRRRRKPGGNLHTSAQPRRG